MKVIYKKPIVEMIDDAIIEAKKNNKDIEKVVLNQEEWEELQDFITRCCIFIPPPKGDFMFGGVKIEVE